MKTPSLLRAIPLGKDGLPMFWQSWDQGRRQAWLDQGTEELERRGIPFRKIFLKELENWNLRARIQRRLNNPTLGDLGRLYDSEERLTRRIQEIVRRAEAGLPLKPTAAKRPAAPSKVRPKDQTNSYAKIQASLAKIERKIKGIKL